MQEERGLNQKKKKKKRKRRTWSKSEEIFDTSHFER